MHNITLRVQDTSETAATKVHILSDSMPPTQPSQSIIYKTSGPSNMTTKPALKQFHQNTYIKKTIITAKSCDNNSMSGRDIYKLIRAQSIATSVVGIISQLLSWVEIGCNSTDKAKVLKRELQHYQKVHTAHFFKSKTM